MANCGLVVVLSEPSFARCLDSHDRYGSHLAVYFGASIDPATSMDGVAADDRLRFLQELERRPPDFFALVSQQHTCVQKVSLV